MKSTALALLKKAETVLQESRDARGEWLAYRTSLARSEAVKRSLAEVDAAIRQALASHADMMRAYTDLDDALAAISRASASTLPPQGAEAGAVDRMQIETLSRADAAFGLALDTAAFRVAQECGRLASVLAPNDSQTLTSLIDSLVRNGADAAANFTPIGNFIAISKAVQRAADDIANHVSKPWPVEIVLADGWFSLSDRLKDQLVECDNWNKLVEADLTYRRHSIQNSALFGTASE
jgi:sulfite reductase alpha subunit-like flavoprotein